MENRPDTLVGNVDKERDPLDALREWYHLVPEDLRRVEYEYYKYFRAKK